MNIWHDLSPKRVKPEDFVALIEIPKGSKNKSPSKAPQKVRDFLSLPNFLNTHRNLPVIFPF